MGLVNAVLQKNKMKWKKVLKTAGYIPHRLPNKQASHSLGIASSSKSPRGVLIFLTCTTYYRPEGWERTVPRHLGWAVVQAALIPCRVFGMNFLRGELQLQKSVGYSQGYAHDKHFPECLIKYLDRQVLLANTLKCSK